VLNNPLAIARAGYLWRLRLACAKFDEQLHDVYDVLDAVLEGEDRVTDGLPEARARYAERLRVDCPSFDEQMAELVRVCTWLFEADLGSGRLALTMCQPVTNGAARRQRGQLTSSSSARTLSDDWRSAGAR
jgi:hypothetical protein